jgi:Rrf2 family protein
MQIPAKADYAIRALLTLAASDVSVSAEHLAQEQALPAKFLGAILSDLRRGGLVTSQRGPEGGFKLARDADHIMIADILRVVSGPMAGVRGMRPLSTKAKRATYVTYGSQCVVRYVKSSNTSPSVKFFEATFPRR